MCGATPDCTGRDINLVCNTLLTTGGEGRCQCRRDMRWNRAEGECQLYLDVDCSTITYTSQPSSTVLSAVERLEREQAATGSQTVSAGSNRTESFQESLATSLLSKIDPKVASEADLKEAYCRDVDAFSFEFARQDGAGVTTSAPPTRRTTPTAPSNKPPLCAPVPRSSCAVAYDDSNCDGGWNLPIAEGEQKFKFFTSFNTYR